MSAPTVAYTTVNGNKYVSHNSKPLIPAPKSQLTAATITPNDAKLDAGSNTLIRIGANDLYEAQDIASLMGKV